MTFLRERIPPEQPYGSLDALLKAQIGVDVAQSCAAIRERTMQAAKKTTGEVLPEDNPSGNNQYKKKEELAKFASSSRSQQSRVKAQGISHYSQRKLDKLARFASEQLERVQQGQVSINRACIDAGLVKEPTPFNALKRTWNKASDTERYLFAEIVREWTVSRMRKAG